MSEQEQQKVRQVWCSIPGCRYRTDPATYDERWEQWSEHYLAEHYDPRWDVPCTRAGCGFVSRAATALDHSRAMNVHAVDHRRAVA